MEILIFCGIYLVELACYLIVMRMLFDVRVRTKVWMVVGILLPVVVEGLPVKASGKNLLVTLSVITIVLISLDGKMLEKIVWLLLTFLLLECIDGAFARVCEKIFCFLTDVYMRNYKYLVVKGWTVACLLFISKIKRRCNKFKKIHINSVIYVVLGSLIVIMMLCLELIDQVVIHLQDIRYIILCNILNFAIFISIFLLVIFIIYIKNTNERMEQLLKTERLLKESQVNYYKQALKKEMDTRKYRHDMMNHLIYVQDVLSRKKIDDAQRYIANILGGFKKIQNTYYIIGSEMVDTIMNYFFGMLPKNVAVDIRGRCPVEIDIEDVEVCTIFSNIFQNVVEEIATNEIQDAEVIIKVNKGIKYVEYNIKNTLYAEINEKSLNKNGMPISHKIDKKNHGIGMVNVRKAIERCNGKFEWHQQDGYFCVNVVLPIK